MLFPSADLLWTAPEHLRDPLLQAKGSEKGDIFALGIILQETALRSAPYSSSDLSYAGIYSFPLLVPLCLTVYVVVVC